MRRLAALLMPALLLASLPAVVLAGERELTGLRLEGPLWRAHNLFVLDWEGAVDDELGYRFLNAPWAPETVVSLGEETRIELRIPTPLGAGTPPPGEYLVEMWLWKHATIGPHGPPSYAILRYDDAAPAPPAGASVPPGWIDGRGPIPVSITHPVSAPASGIRGYAVSLTARPESPCAVPTRCTDAELDLPGGVGDDRLQLGDLPEGVDYLNVVTVSASGMASPPLSVPIHVDGSAPAIRFAGLPDGWVDHPVTIIAIAEDPFSGMAPAGPNGSFTALAVDGGVPTLALTDTVAATVSGEGTHQLAGWGRDALGNAGGPATARTATVRIDETPPRVAFAAAQRPDDPELIAVTVADALAGPSPGRGSIEVRPAGTGRRFEALPTRTTGSGLLARWNSDDFPAGSYEFRATGFDAAGNPAQTVSRSDGTPMVLRNPIKVPSAIESGFGGAKLVWQHCHRVDGGRQCKREAVTDFDSRPAVRTVPYERPLRFGGVLHSTAGAPLAGLPVEVVETFAPGADAAQRRTTVITRPDGRFDSRLAAGPSRRVEAFFAGTRTLTRSVGRAVTMAVRAGIRFRASTTAARIGGEPVTFGGRLLADEAAIPRTGRPIQLQFRVPGGTWTEFRTVQTDRSGRFRYPYAFTDDDSRGIRFQFRAASPEQAGWPYRPAASAPVSVTGY